MKNDKRNQWKFGIIFCLLTLAFVFLYLGRTETLFGIIGGILFVIALLIINWIDKKTKG